MFILLLKPRVNHEARRSSPTFFLCLKVLGYVSGDMEEPKN